MTSCKSDEGTERYIDSLVIMLNQPVIKLSAEGLIDVNIETFLDVSILIASF